MHAQYSQGDGDQHQPIDDKMQGDPRPGIFEPLRDKGDRQADRQVREQNPGIEDDVEERPKQPMDGPGPLPIAQFLSWQNVATPPEFFPQDVDHQQEQDGKQPPSVPY